jgi:hypothetical protein
MKEGREGGRKGKRRKSCIMLLFSLSLSLSLSSSSSLFTLFFLSEL